ncbi:hypothetical protein KKC1_25070 [Calderihabitans maritimus]|uniref:Uncharacterized protein n=1 Tax=Calderihabitans maritimus TaxID=1246530 RepID=A0A1Z5HVM2_9FIRM|nr:hypothetical protein KKC1_25070 [Calderihabitans maritimus]
MDIHILLSQFGIPIVYVNAGYRVKQVSRRSLQGTKKGKDRL